MGFLKDCGSVVAFQDAKQQQERLKMLTVNQFIFAFEQFMNWKDETMKESEIRWGYQIQGHRLIYDNFNQKFDYNLAPLATNLSFPLIIEYGKWMFQIAPNSPFKTQSNLSQVIESFRSQYYQLKKTGDIYLTIPSIPFFGVVSEQKSKCCEFKNSHTFSRYIEDTLIVDHIRPKTIQSNIRQRRGKNVEVKIPIFKDKYTNLEKQQYLEPFPGFIHLDTSSSASVSCLQCTFQASGIEQARFTYDNLHVLTPLFLAMTAGTSILKGKLSDYDTRWKMLIQCIDDRTQQQKDPLNPGYLPRSRYAAISHYISTSKMNRPQYNDVPAPINKDIVDHVKNVLKSKNLNMDQNLVNHLGIIFKREHLLVFDKFLEMQQSDQSLFEMFNGSLYESMRFKVALEKDLGWRNEFRTMQVQLTADENAAWSILVYLMVQMIYYVPNLNFYIPLSKVDENFERSQQKNAIVEAKFFFRINIQDTGAAIIKQMTLSEIFFGSKQIDYIGLIPFYIQFAQSSMLPQFAFTKTIRSLEKFLKKKLSGQIPTLAQWQRKFVHAHKDYKQDSIVSESIWNDMLSNLVKISIGQIKDSTFAPIFDV